ncbi:alpha/beta hydrolase [Caballeronia glathei]|uniref:Alpha/beta hydrolase n=2 Tax=Caballeronia glathei TaxID=60547 RepID=A0A069PM56_9BURK|nr:alpha/beta hydrolase [Caballeronia glathei]KDR38381.1 alpha/beta hydrolase [Caballeronia glathei]
MYMPWESHRIHYTDEGQGSPLVLLHGLGGRASNWTYQRQHFAVRQRVICLELPGHGASEGREVKFSAYWTVLAALLDHLDIEAADLCGLSKGARVGLDLAARMPTRVRRLVVVNAFAHLEQQDRLERTRLYAMLGQPGGSQLWANQLIALMGVQDHPAIANGFRRAALQLNATHIQSIFNELIEYDQRPLLPQVMAPTMLVRGMHDGFVPEYCVEEMHRFIPYSSVVHLEDAGHLPYLEQPGAFNDHLASFLGQREPRLTLST